MSRDESKNKKRRLDDVLGVGTVDHGGVDVMMRFKNNDPKLEKDPSDPSQSERIKKADEKRRNRAEKRGKQNEPRGCA